MNLERADQAPWVAPRAIGGRGIDPPELGVERVRALLVEAPLERRSEGWVGRRAAEIPTVEHGAEIEARPSLEHRHVPSSGDLGNRPKRDPLVVGGGEWRVGVDDVDAMQENTTQLRSAGFVGADVTVAKDLARIHGNQLALEPLGDADGQLGLAAGRRPDDRQHAQVGYGRLNRRLNW